MRELTVLRLGAVSRNRPVSAACKAYHQMQTFKMIFLLAIVLVFLRSRWAGQVWRERLFGHFTHQSNLSIILYEYSRLHPYHVREQARQEAYLLGQWVISWHQLVKRSVHDLLPCIDNRHTYTHALPTTNQPVTSMHSEPPCSRQMYSCGPTCMGPHHSCIPPSAKCVPLSYPHSVITPTRLLVLHTLATVSCFCCAAFKGPINDTSVTNLA